MVSAKDFNEIIETIDVLRPETATKELRSE